MLGHMKRVLLKEYGTWCDGYQQRLAKKVRTDQRLATDAWNKERSFLMADNEALRQSVLHVERQNSVLSTQVFKLNALQFTQNTAGPSIQPATSAAWHTFVDSINIDDSIDGEHLPGRREASNEPALSLFGEASVYEECEKTIDNVTNDASGDNGIIQCGPTSATMENRENYVNPMTPAASAAPLEHSPHRPRPSRSRRLSMSRASNIATRKPSQRKRRATTYNAYMFRQNRKRQKFACNVAGCNRTYVQRYSLLRHQKRVH